ncbi:type II secretion system F family protein [Catenulispora pinisilvae]|uniref:type II secretion system F family protein n=1 Tax=Catenulispora pinisilvae TaxID=2705253 RepID=UPI001890E33F|nr:hypothetical protein [Catenulispora pinisilvae]
MNDTGLLLFVTAASVVLVAGLYVLASGFRERPPRRPRPSRLRTLDLRAAIGQRKRSAVALTVGVVFGVWTGWPLAFAAGVLGCWHLPRLLGPDTTAAERIATVEAIATWTEMLRDTLSAAAGLAQAVLASTGVAPYALREPLGRLGASLRARVPFAQALEAFGEDLADPIADQVVVCLVHAHSHQVKYLSDLLSELAEAARAQVSLAVQVNAERAKHRTSMRAITSISLAMAVGFSVFYPPFVAPYSTPAGQGVLLVVIGLFAFSFVLMRRTFRPRPTPRLLVLADTSQEA